MKIIGLTGSIGMGKSTVAKMLADLGIPFHDADAAVHLAMAPDGEAVAHIKKAFPNVIEKNALGSDFVNRQKLGKEVFNDVAKLKTLEDILHPLARASSDKFLEDCRAKDLEFAVLDIPLLFETGSESRVDVTFCVSAAKSIQRQRVLARPGMTKDKFENILKRQMPDAEKQKRADYVIKTDTTLEATKNQVQTILRDLRRI